VPEERQGTSEVGSFRFRLHQYDGRRHMQGVSIRGPWRKLRDVQVQPDGAPADEARKGMRRRHEID
jgi:hypothetical protein